MKNASYSNRTEYDLIYDLKTSVGVCVSANVEEGVAYSLVSEILQNVCIFHLFNV